MAQTYLEEQAIESRRENIVKNNQLSEVLTGYNNQNEYSNIHKNAKGGNDVQGKGTDFGGHTHIIPNNKKSKSIDYSTFSTDNGGNLYDIEGINGKGGRSFLTSISKYNKELQYGPNMIDTSANKADGQIII